MIDTQEMYEWRWKDESNGLVLPYYTRPALDWLSKLDLKGKSIFEFGIGASTIWYAQKGARIYGVDNNPAWFRAVCEAVGTIHVNWLMFRTMPTPYVNSILECDERFDIIVIDGIERDECVEPALKRLNDDGYLIIDNWDQKSVWVAKEETKELLMDYYFAQFSQPGHPDWKTAVFSKHKMNI